MILYDVREGGNSQNPAFSFFSKSHIEFWGGKNLCTKPVVWRSEGGTLRSRQRQEVQEWCEECTCSASRLRVCLSDQIWALAGQGAVWTLTQQKETKTKKRKMIGQVSFTHYLSAVGGEQKKLGKANNCVLYSGFFKGCNPAFSLLPFTL